MSTPPTVVSLLPSTTEIVCSLGFKSALVGRSHECDYPKSVNKLPSCTEPKFDPDGTSYQIDQRIKALLQEGLSVYRVDAQKLANLRPDVILTQDHCEVCAAPLSEVEQAVQQYLDYDVTIISVSPTDLSGVLDSIQTIADALEVPEKGKQVVQSMREDFKAIRLKSRLRSPRKLLCLEWLDPLMTAGNWVPELVEIAGGMALGAQIGQHSPFIDWEKIRELEPDVITVMPCGYDIKQTMQEMGQLTSHPAWSMLPAVQKGEVYILEGNQYFNRPGPRLVDSVQILFEILHPDEADKQFLNTGWIPLEHAPEELLTQKKTGNS